MKVLICLAYDGQPFYGWQFQNTQQPTVQSTLESVLSMVYNQSLRVWGASRTDRGVHARGQLATVLLPSRKFETQVLLTKLNKLLSPHIFVQQVREVPESFRLHHEVRYKIYTYHLWGASRLTPFYHQRAHLVSPAFSSAGLEEIFSPFVGTHDFRHFSNVGSQPKTTLRSVDSIRVRRRGAMILVRFRGRGFLKQMVRNLVGTALYCKDKGIPPTQIQAWLKAPQKALEIRPAPAHALCLTRIELRGHP
jgi:tRNA pseudouridine38-40 synthase